MRAQIDVATKKKISGTYPSNFHCIDDFWNGLCMYAMGLLASVVRCKSLCLGSCRRRFFFFNVKGQKLVSNKFSNLFVGCVYNAMRM